MSKSSVKSFAAFAALTFLGLSAVSNWFVHQPRARQVRETANWPRPLAAWAVQFGNASADFTDSLGLTGHDASLPLTTPMTTNRLVYAGWPVRRPGGPAPDDITVLHKKGFALGYSPSLRHPVWAAYKASPVRKAIPPPRPAGFKPDQAAPRSPYSREYSKSGYDRGHMAPNLAIATRYGKDAQEQTFLTSNICPQRPGLNQGPWRDLEFRIAELWPDCYGDIWVIVGAVTAPDDKRLPSGIDVPQAFYQIVVAQQKNSVRVLAVYMPQNTGRRSYARATLVSIDEIEARTGFDFLQDLPDAVETPLESAVPSRLWPVGTAGFIRLLGEHIRFHPDTLALRNDIRKLMRAKPRKTAP